MSENKTFDIFNQEVEETEVKQEYDPNKALFHLPPKESGFDVSWFLAKEHFGIPKATQDCTRSLFVRFLSWQIQPETQNAYRGSGKNDVGVLRNQLVNRFHSVPDGYIPGHTGRARIPCGMMFGDECACCQQFIAANKRYTRESQPQGYWGKVTFPMKVKDTTIMSGMIYTGSGVEWETKGDVKVFEFTNYARSGSTFTQLIDNRSNDADKRIRINKKSYAGFNDPVALKITYSWPIKDGRVERSQFATWTPIDVTPFPVAARGPDVSVKDKEKALALANLDPALWINKDAFSNVDYADVAKWLNGCFEGTISVAPSVDLDTCNFGQLLKVIETNKAKFNEIKGFDPADFDVSMVEPLREIVKGVLNG